MPGTDVRKKTRWTALAALMALPALLLSFHLYFVKTVDDGRFQINTDPDYAYLLSAIDLSKLKISKMVLHPGTTLQVLSHLLMKAAYVFHPGSDGEFRSSVLRRPGYYLNVLQAVFSFLNILLVLALGIFTFRMTRKMAPALLIQSTPFFSSQILVFGFRKVTADILMISVLFVMVLLLMKRLAGESGPGGRQGILLSSLGYGALTGFALATKVTFLPAVIIFIMVLPSLRARVSYCLAAAGSTVAFTLPIASQYADNWRFIIRIFTHKGIYGNGAPAIFDGREYAANLMNIFLENLPFCLLLLFSVLFLVGSHARGKWRKTGESIFRCLPGRMLAAVSLVQLAGILLVARHFKSKYLLPGLCFSALAVYLLFLLAGGSPAEKHSPRLSRRWRLPAALLFMLFSFLVSFHGAARYHRFQSQRKMESLSIQGKLSHEYRDFCLIYYFNAPAVVFGLEIGNKWTPVYRKPLFDIYGERYFYNHRTQKIYSWSGHRVTIEELKNTYRDKIILFGNTFSALKEKQGTSVPPFPVKDIFGGRHFTLYQAVGRYAPKRALKSRFIPGPSRNGAGKSTRPRLPAGDPPAGILLRMPRLTLVCPFCKMRVAS